MDIKHRCDGIWDCVNGEDELSCNTICDKVDQFACKNRECIPQSQYCNGQKDCTDGTDELFECNCHKNGQFACASNDECVPRLKVCDAILDCSDGSDERGCGAKISTTISPPKFPVSVINEDILHSSLEISKPEPLPEDAQEHAEKAQQDSSEDAFVDYPEAQPIIQSPYHETGFESANQIMENSKYNLKVYPQVQEVYEGHDVVLQCRDEGDLRAPVVWKRPNGKPLPKPSHQEYGRLEITSVLRFQEGSYLCVVENDQDHPEGQTVAEVKVVTYPTHEYGWP